MKKQHVGDFLMFSRMLPVICRWHCALPCFKGLKLSKDTRRKENSPRGSENDLFEVFASHVVGAMELGSFKVGRRLAGFAVEKNNFLSFS